MTCRSTELYVLNFFFTFTNSQERGPWMVVGPSYAEMQWHLLWVLDSTWTKPDLSTAVSMSQDHVSQARLYCDVAAMRCPLRTCSGSGHIRSGPRNASYLGTRNWPCHPHCLSSPSWLQPHCTVEPYSWKPLDLWSSSWVFCEPHGGIAASLGICFLLLSQQPAPAAQH